MRSESSSSGSGCCSSGADDGARTRRLTTRGDSEHRAERPPATAHVRPHRAGNQRRGAGGADRVSRPADVAGRGGRGGWWGVLLLSAGPGRMGRPALCGLLFWAGFVFFGGREKRGGGPDRGGPPH